MNRRMHRWIFCLGMGLSLAGGSLAAPRSAFSQEAPGMDGGTLRQMLKARMTSMGMTSEQLRQRLAELGHDPSILDAYLDESQAPPAAADRVVAAARALGALEVPPPETNAPDRPAPALAPPQAQDGLPIFGLDVFSRSSAQSQPVTSGPVPGTYVLGPGDEIVLILTGDVELAYTLPITREGFIVVPQVGQIWVNGITLDSFRDQMYTHLGRVYSGISRSADASTRFDVSLGRLRTNQVFITGGVAQPGTYMLSPVASVLNGLYQAGGPTAHGSMRDVQIMRGGRVVQRVDLYEYLLQGNNLDEIRLGPGDVIFVPQAGPRVALRGTVRREAIYELKPGETLAHLMFFAGGPTTSSSLRRARVTRVLAPSERRVAGVDRTVIDVDLADALERPATAPALRDQDEVRIFPVRTEVRNTVTLNGSVWNDGSFAYQRDMRAWDLISLGNGLTPDAYLDRAHISRLNLADSTVTIVPFSLARGPDGKPLENPVLQEFDVVRVFSKAQIAEDYHVAIQGAVKKPGSERFQERMTLRDLILLAGGLDRMADMTVEISRIGSPQEREAGKIAEIIKVRLDSSYIMSDEVRRHYLGARDSLSAKSSGAENMLLKPYDQVFVRTIPYLSLERRVTVTGNVKYPGTYSLSRNDDTVHELLFERAGGLLENAYPEGVKVVRDGKEVDVRFAEVIKNPRSPNNMVLQPGDSIIVPEYSPVVTIQGAVQSPTSVLYKKGKGLDYYIDVAGGYAPFADEDRVSIKYANGSSQSVRKVLLVKNKPDPKPGSVIVVPLVPVEQRQPFNTQAFVKDLTQIAATIGAVVLVILRTN